MTATAPISFFRGLLAVLAGLLVAAALMIGSNLLLIRRFAPTAPAFLAITLLLGIVFQLLGGYTGAALSRDSRPAIATLVFLGTLLMLSSVIQTWTQMPPWYSVAMLLIAAGGLTLGARLHAA